MTRLAPTPESELELATAKALLHNLGADPMAHHHWTTMGKAIGAVCRVRGCDRTSDALGMCLGHYKRHTRAVANEARLINRAAA